MKDTNNPCMPESVSIRQVVLECVFLFLAVAAIKFFMKNSPVMSALIGINIIARFVFIRRKHDWIFFIIGLVAGGGNDLLSMIKGVYFYTPRDILPVPIPIWMLFFWGHIFTAFRQLMMLPAFQGPPVEKPWRIDFRLIADLAVIILFRIIIYNSVRQEPFPAVGYAIVLALRLLVIPPEKHEWLLMALALVMGPAFEAVLIHLGLYVYYDPIFLGMPAWLLIYWAFIIPIFTKGIFARLEWALA